MPDVTITQQHTTQRIEDRAVGAVLAKWMTEDPKRRGIPLFLQVQNRRPLAPEQRARLDALARSTGASSSGRTDYRKPKGMSWEEWDALEAARVLDKKAASYERINELRARAGLPEVAPSVPRARSAGKLPPAGSKAAMIAELLLRPDGCTTAEVLAASGWPAVSMPAQARTAGLVLRKERVDGVLRYYGTRG